MKSCQPPSWVYLGRWVWGSMDNLPKTKSPSPKCFPAGWNESDYESLPPYMARHYPKPHKIHSSKYLIVIRSVSSFVHFIILLQFLIKIFYGTEIGRHWFTPCLRKWKILNGCGWWRERRVLATIWLTGWPIDRLTIWMNGRRNELDMVDRFLESICEGRRIHTYTHIRI